MPRGPRSILALQIICGLALMVAIGLCWIDSEIPLWEAQSPDGSYVLGWRTALVSILLFGFTQWVSLVIFRRIKQSVKIWEIICRYQVLVALVVILALALSGAGWLHTAGRRGQLVAYLDSATGRTRLLGVGLPPPWRADFARLLRERHGIEFRAVAGCIVSKPLLDYVEAYNQVSVTAARKKWGRDVVQECMVDAQKMVPTGGALN